MSQRAVSVEYWYKVDWNFSFYTNVQIIIFGNGIYFQAIFLYIVVPFQ